MSQEDFLASNEQQQEALALKMFQDFMKELETMKMHAAKLDAERRAELAKSLNELTKELTTD